MSTELSRNLKKRILARRYKEYMITDELVNPRSIVVVGGSNDMSKPGGTLLGNILNGGYRGNIYVLNPREKTVKGLPTFKDAGSLPDSGCAIFAVPASNVIETAEILASEKKTKAFIVLSAGFGETGPEGRALEERLTRIVNSVNGTLIGPNCTGVLLPGFAGVFAGPVPQLDPRGIDFASASGAVAVFTMERAIPMGIRFASVIAVGNSAQCGVEDVVKYWDETFHESGSKVKLLYMEQVRNPELLIRHCSSLVSKGCRIAAVKAGTTEAGSRAALSHTGALAGPEIAVDALFRKCGITRCTGREELVYTAGILMHRVPGGRNFAVITHAGGPGVMAADALSQNGLNVPHIHGPAADRLKDRLFHGSSTANPIDFIGTGTAEQLGMILDFTDRECPGIDSSIVIFGSPGLFDVKPVYDLLDEKMKASAKPVFPVLPSTLIASGAVEHFTGLGRVFFPDEVLLAKSLAAVCNTNAPFSHQVTAPRNADNIRSIIAGSPDGYLPPDIVRKILNAAGIPHARQITAYHESEIEFAAAALGFPLAMKATGPVHKSDAGGVKLNISSIDRAKASYRELMEISGSTGVVMQEMASGLELFIGGKREPGYGHIILCGIGGIFVETLKDISAGIAPVGMDEALDMIRRLRGHDLIKGAIGVEGISEENFAKIITSLSGLLSAAPEIREIDINPLIGTGEKIQSVDCRIFIDKKKQ